MTKAEYKKKRAELKEVCDDAYQAWGKAYKAINDLEESWVQESEVGK